MWYVLGAQFVIIILLARLTYHLEQIEYKVELMWLNMTDENL